MRRTIPLFATFVFLAAAPTKAEDAPWMPGLSDLDKVLTVTRDPDVRITGIVGDAAFVQTPDGKTTLAPEDLVRYRGELYRVRFDGEHLALIALEGQDSVLLPVRGGTE